MDIINKDAKKFIVVISDLHLGAGQYISGKKNLLEDFYHDNELKNFFNHFNRPSYKEKEIEIIINGDFLDFLAIPYVRFFDDEYWSEEASVEKLELIYEGHTEVFKAINNFLKNPTNQVTYIIGNHDAELVLPKVREKLLSYFDSSIRERFVIIHEKDTYEAAPGIFLQHGHQYEKAHAFDPQKTTQKTQEGNQYLVPAWGSYYCHMVINKYKPEKEYINQIMPIKKYLIHGLVYDTFFTLRFIFATVYYFNMIRFWNLYLKRFKLNVIYKDIKEELILFQNYETLTRRFFKKNESAKLLITGHTHHPSYRLFQDNTTFINTGTWTRIVNLDFSYQINGHRLTFAFIELNDTNYTLDDYDKNVRSRLLEWRGDSSLPYKEFRH